MPILTKEQRKQLSKVVLAARAATEPAARKALHSLGVDEADAPSYLSAELRTLRRALRAQARQLGDKEDPRKKGSYDLYHLTEKIAYDQWHRMLFARFLAENDLLISPDHGVAVSLAECRELAPEIGLKDEWDVAVRFAAKSLPQIFRPDDPAGKIELAPEDRASLRDLVVGLTRETFLAADSLGWCYQFWQAERKDQVNAAGNKIGADELPAVTQLFTEDYMVDFLLDNTLGAWHAGKVLAANSKLAENAESEDELRQAVALPGCPWKYLRFIKVEAASSRLSLEPKHMEGASTLKLGYLDPHADIENLSGNLPHWRQNQVTYFVTFRTADSLPQEKLRQWTTEKEAWLQQHPEPHDEQTRQAYYDQFPRRIQEWLDQGYGDCLLRKPELKARVADALKHFDRDRYHLDEFVVEANHVHVLVTPTVGHELADIVHSWKSFTANVINRETGQVGAFWQKESFDHIVRSPAQLEKIRSYIREHQGYDKVEAASSRLAPEEKRQDAASTLWTPAAGTFDGWPKTAQDLTCLDPCMGSGHFVVAMFERLVALRMAEEKLDEAAAVAAVIGDNLYGLEIDPRCTQIGAFNLALAAWRRVGYCALPAMNLACSGLAPNAKLEDWLKIAGNDQKLQRGMERLYRLFQKAAVLGSLINPRAHEGDLLVATFHELQPLLEKALAQETKDDIAHEMAVTAQGLAKAAEILAGQFTLVATNVPYLGRGKHDEALRGFVDGIYPDAKADLATCFVERCLAFCTSFGSTTLVTPQNWLFLGTYSKLRQRLLHECEWNLVCRLGARAFETITGEIVNVALVCLTNGTPHVAQQFAGLDASTEKSSALKAAHLSCGPIQSVVQRGQLRNAGANIGFHDPSDLPLLGHYASCFAGILNGDSPKFRRTFWEFATIPREWVFQQSTVETTVFFGGREGLIYFDEENGHLREEAIIRKQRLHDSDQRGNAAWRKKGVGVSQMSDVPVSLYSGEKFDSSLAVIYPRVQNLVPALWAFCSDPDFKVQIRRINQKLSIENGYFEKLPFDLAHWQKVAAEKYPYGLPKPFSSDPTQWLFNGNPEGSDQPLHVVVARLLGYQWPRQTGSSFPDCPALGLDGLAQFADDDGIVCINPIKGEQAAAERLRALFAATFGSEWAPGLQNELLELAGFGGKPIEDWLRNGFFEQHCQLFHQRPFIWQIWDGRRDGFNALVNYHKLNRSNLEKLTYTFLGDWIARQKSANDAGEEGSDARLQAAHELKSKLEKIIEGEAPYDIFVRWKSLEKQTIGWEPDLNDGVRLTIRPFVEAGVLRKNPKINWNKDRGKDVASAPWYKVFKGDRINDHHLAVAEKRKARGKN